MLGDRVVLSFGSVPISRIFSSIMLSQPFLTPFAQTKYFIRAIGFELLNTLFRRWTASEPPKPVLRRSRWIALSRCAIHILPCLVFLFLIPLNYSAMYLGPGFSYRKSDEIYLVLFQIAAKILEIVCVASLTTVVLHVLRHELLRDGVPLGFVGSGMFFSQANWFWSPEMFVGALHCVKSWKRLRLLMVIIMAGVLALLIAPSSAVLLQPRIQTVSAGGTAYFLPATPDQLWPSEVNGSDELSECFGEYASQNVVCASAGFESLRDYFTNFNSSFNIPSMMRGTYDMSPLVIQSLAAKTPRLINSGTVFGFNRETSILQPNAITAILQDSLTGDWHNGTKNWSGNRFSAGREYQYADEVLSSVLTTSPVVLARCAPAQNVSAGQVEVNFPVKTWVTRTLTPSDAGSTQWQDDQKPFNITILDPSNSSNLRFEWIALPMDQFGPVSGGVLLHFPGNVLNTSRVVVGCSISASWFSGEMTSDSLINEAAWSFSESSKSFARIRTDLNASSAEAYGYRRLITVGERWIQSLTPFTPCEDCDNQSNRQTTLERLFSDVGLSTVLDDMRVQGQFRYNQSTDTCVFQPSNPADMDVDRWNFGDCGNGNKHALLELILASVFANGLSRYGSRRAFDPSSMNSRNDPFQWELMAPPKAPNYYTSLLSNNPHRNAILPAPVNSDYVELQMRVEIVGYAWYASGFSGYLATAVVVMYMLVALAHTAWVLAKGVTSSSWDTITELLALALQSPVSEALRGSGAGIERLGTYRWITRLRAMREQGEERLALVIDGDEEYGKAGEQAPRAGYSRVEVDSEYS